MRRRRHKWCNIYTIFTVQRDRASELASVSNRTLSRIKTEPEKGILTSRKPRSDKIELMTLTSVLCQPKHDRRTRRSPTRYSSCNQSCVIFHIIILCRLRSRHQNCPRTPDATMVLERLRKQLANAVPNFRYLFNKDS